MPPDPDLARRSHDILTRAMDLPRAGRAAFARTACGGDDALTARVLALLAAADTRDTFLDRPILDATAIAREPAAPLPDAIGTYLVVGVLGSGGMATVYEAEQEQPRRRVALKVLHQSMTSADAYRRFQFETEALARLHHPGIAQIYEAGVAQLGGPQPAPFFAMELVADAASITSYASRAKLSIRDRAEMLAAVCDAVHHGHQHGIIHRDIKPANVLVGADGRVKVIDFGVARAIGAGARASTTITGQPQLIGTLNYMSPEQCIAPASIDTRADVYALGVLLFELICSRQPHDLAGLPIPAAVRRIVDDPPPRPPLPPTGEYRDLSAIILRAMAKDPEDRYPSAASLAADLRRFLASEPTEARPPGVVGQARLFARRHRAIVVAAGALAATVILIAIISSVFAIRLNQEVERRRTAELLASRERDRARWEAYTAQIASAFSAMKTGEFQQMRSRLAAAAEQPRDWEWGFLSRLADRSAQTVAAHDGRVMSLIAQGDQFITTGSDGAVCLWERATLARRATFQSDSAAQSRAAIFTPEGVISGDDMGFIRILDPGTLAERMILASMSGPIRSLAHLPDGTTAAAADNGPGLIIGPDTMRMFGADQVGGVQGLALSPDERLLATFNDAGAVHLRDAASLATQKRLEFPGSVNQVHFSSDAGLVAAAGAGGLVRVWDAYTGGLLREIATTQGVNTVRSIAFSNDNTLLAVGLVHRGILIYQVSSGRLIGELGGHTDAVSGLVFSPDDQLLVSASWDGSIRTWRADEFESPPGIKTLAGHSGYVFDVAFAPAGSHLASVGADGALILWDAATSAPVARLSDRGPSLAGLDYSSDGALIAAACADATIRILDSAAGRELGTLSGHDRWVACVAFDPASARIASGGQDRTVRIWDLATGQATAVLRGHTERINAVRFSPDGRLIASASRDGSVRLWDADSGEQVALLSGHTSDVFTVLFSADGSRLYSGSRDQTIRVWDAASGAPIAVIEGHGQPVTCLALNPSQTRLAAGSWYGQVVLIDVATLDQIASFSAHDAAIRGISFSADGRWLATGSFDGTVRLFDSATREEAESAGLTADSR